MSLDPTKFKFSKTYLVISYGLTIVSPFITFLLIYDKSLIFQMDALKLITISIAVGVPFFLFNQLISSIFVGIINKIVNQKANNNEETFQVEDNIAIVCFSVANYGAILNLARLKYFLHEKKQFWLVASIETWLLIEILLIVSFMCLVALVYFFNRAKAKK